MARNGYKIFDSDTHVGPYMEVLSAYLTDAEKKRLPAWEEHRNVSKQGYQLIPRGSAAIAGGWVPPARGDAGRIHGRLYRGQEGTRGRGPRRSRSRRAHQGH